jgi:asparagine synthase (glutamine-hydrolysing)
MCGFAGIVSWDDRHRVHRAVLENMSARVAHRGPDDQGLWINHEEEASPGRPQVGLAFRRLSIIDLDPRANQPFTDGRGRWLVFNGEIYNYRELRRELEGLLPDYAWRTQGDAEVLLASYAAWGERCVEKLNGMFAFAVWDEGKGELFLARDRMGQKPLYVALIGSDGRAIDLIGEGTGEPSVLNVKLAAVAFASELTAVTASGLADTQLDAGALTAYLQFGYFSGGESVYRGIRQIAPATIVHYRSGSLTVTVYWPIQKPGYENGAATSDSVAVAQTRKLLTKAVRAQLVADVPVGCLLSGGIDSSIVAAAMKATAGAGQAVMTFSIGFDDPRYDESQHARRVAEHLGTTHHAFVVRPDAARDLPRLAAIFGEPFGDSSALPTHYLAREVRQYVKVALGGDGGDELFGGYDRYRAMAVARSLRRALTPLPFMVLGPLLRRLPGVHPKSRAMRVKRFLTSVAASPRRRFATYHRLFDGDTIVRLLGPALSPPIASSYGPTHNDRMYHLFGTPHQNVSGWPHDRIRDPVRAALALDRMLYLPDDLLTKVDRCSMLHALEVRSPFMDHELVQFAATLSTPQLLKGGPKRMLREAFADLLPAWVFKRKKMGFAVPIGEWFRGELRAMLHDHLFAVDSFAAGHFNTAVVRRLVEEHEAERVDHSQRLYALLMLELWWKQQKR